MDSITQGLLGATIAQAAYRERLGGRAVVWGAICAVAPDFDFLAGLAGDWAGLMHHRGLSHSLLVLTAVTPLVGWIGHRFGKGAGNWWGWITLTWWALVTHPLLDGFTSYGTQLFAPITDTRFAWDGVAIVDPVYTVPLLVAVLVAARRAGRSVRSRKVAIAALAFTQAYLGFGLFQSRSAKAEAERDLRRRGFEPVRVRAFPTVLNAFVYRVVAHDAEGNYRLTMVSRTRSRKLQWTALSSSEDPLVERVLSSERGKQYRWFCDDLFVATVDRSSEQGAEVTVSDLRYGSVIDPRISMWGVDVAFDSSEQIHEWSLWRRPNELDMKAEMRHIGWLIGGSG